MFKFKMKSVSPKQAEIEISKSHLRRERSCLKLFTLLKKDTC